MHFPLKETTARVSLFSICLLLFVRLFLCLRRDLNSFLEHFRRIFKSKNMLSKFFFICRSHMLFKCTNRIFIHRHQNHAWKQPSSLQPTKNCVCFDLSDGLPPARFRNNIWQKVETWISTITFDDCVSDESRVCQWVINRKLKVHSNGFFDLFTFSMHICTLIHFHESTLVSLWFSNFAGVANSQLSFIHICVCVWCQYVCLP